MNIKFFLLLITALVCCKPNTKESLKQEVLIKLCVEDDQITDDWIDALERREPKAYLDSLKKVVLPLNEEELAWYNLITSRAEVWSQMRDSIRIPFENISTSDTIQVFLGYQGLDDAFSHNLNTVCFDLTAMHNTYGSAMDPVNTNRADRFFAHEYTHLLSKEWARQNTLTLQNFRDSILWECIYEGLGMYRSMSEKWFPVQDSLSPIAASTFEDLYPIFTDRMIGIHAKDEFSSEEKRALHRYLSYGSMKKKWGALPIGVWLALEARGNDKNLIKWVNQGHKSVMPLAQKYLPQHLKDSLRNRIENQN